MSYQKDYKDPGMVKKVTDFLFSAFDEEKIENIDVRTDIPGKEMFQTLSYYRGLELLGCKTAGKIANLLERLLISVERTGRIEGVSVLQQKLPKTEKLYSAVETLISEEETT